MLLDKRTIEDNYLSLLRFHDAFYVEKINATYTLTKMHFLNFRLVTQLPFDTLAKLLCTSPREIINMKERKTFEPIVADRFMAVIQMYCFLYRKLPFRENANYWMCQPRKELGMRSPVDVMETLTGVKMVRDCLHAGGFTIRTKK